LFFSLTSLGFSQGVTRDNERPSACDQWESFQIPSADLPTPDDREALASCNAENLYFGFDHPADLVKSRKCAYLQRQRGAVFPEVVFGSSGLLAMIYANGKGAARSFDLALKFSCEIDGAPAENFGRFNHLLKLKEENWKGDDFSLCDDATSSLMAGWCADLRERFVQASRARKLNSLVEKWTPPERTAFVELQKAAESFFQTSSGEEVEQSGSLRAVFVITANAALSDGFVIALLHFEEGQVPGFSAAEFRKADDDLNAAYLVAISKEQARMSTIKPEGIQLAQRAWIQYREAWVNFGLKKYPGVKPESWRTWLTLERIRMLRNYDLAVHLLSGSE
jgi:hypothetical protein